MTVKSLFMETVPATVPIDVGDGADVKVCYCVVCVCFSQCLGGFEC